MFGGWSEARLRDKRDAYDLAPPKDGDSTAICDHMGSGICILTPWKINRWLCFSIGWCLGSMLIFQGCVFQLFLDCVTNYLIYYFHVDLNMPVKQQKIRFLLGGGFKYFLFSPLFGEDSHFDEYFWNGLKPPTRYVCLGLIYHARASLEFASMTGVIGQFLKHRWSHGMWMGPYMIWYHLTRLPIWKRYDPGIEIPEPTLGWTNSSKWSERLKSDATLLFASSRQKS